VRGVLGAALLIKARAVSLACGPREDVVLQPDSGDGGGGVRGGDERCGRDDGRGPRVSDPGRGRREAAGGLAAAWAGRPAGLGGCRAAGLAAWMRRPARLLAGPRLLLLRAAGPKRIG
jgi:hypothetical protein